MTDKRYHETTDEDILTHVLCLQKKLSRLYSEEENEFFEDCMRQIESDPDFDRDYDYKQKSIGIMNTRNSIYREMVMLALGDEFPELEKRIYKEIEVKNRDFIKRERAGEKKPSGYIQIDKNVLSVSLKKWKLGDAFTYKPTLSKRQRT